MARRRHLRLLWLCAAFAFPRVVAAHHTEPALWLNSSGGSFDDLSNWSIGVVPGLHDTVYFDLAHPVYTTTFAGSVQNVQAIIGGNDVTFDLLGNTYKVYDLMGIDITNAMPNAATLRIRNGTVISTVGASIGRDFTTAGNLYIDGSSAAMKISMDLKAAGNGSANIEITNGATLSNRNAYLSTSSRSKSHVLISGAGSRWDNKELHIGSTLNTPAEVHIAGGTVSASSFIKIRPSGKVFLEGGQIETPQLEIEAGMFSALGSFAGSLINRGGSIDVPSGQTLTLEGNLLSPNGDTLIKTGAGQLTINGPQDHAPTSSLRVSNGKIVLNSNAGVAATATTPAVANLLLSIDPIAAAITFNADQDLAQLTVNASADGRQAVDLASPAAAGAFRSLRIADITAKADLWTSIANANQAAAADSNDGIFDSGLASHPGSALGLATKIDSYGSPYLLIRPTRIGDLNLDGMVSISDFIDLAAKFGSASATWQDGDLNYDNQVSIGDFIDLAANFGSSYSADAMSVEHPVAVPEPIALGAVILAMTLAGRRRRR